MMFEFITKAKVLFSYAAPIGAAQFIHVLASFMPMLFIAQLGTQPLAAAAIGSATFIIFNASAMFAMMAMGILFSYEYEQNNRGEIGVLFSHGFVLGIAMAGFLGLILWNMGGLLLLLGQKRPLVNLVIPYLHLAAISLLPMVLITLIKQFYIGIGKPRVSLYISLMLTPLCILFSYALILGKFSMPQMGLVGMMAAMLMSQCVVLLIMVCFFIFTGQHIKYHLTHKLSHFSRETCKSIVNLALPMSIQCAAEIIAISIITYFMGWFGKIPLAAAQIVNQYVILFVVIYIGFSQAVALVCSKAQAHGDFQEAKEYTQVAIAIMTALFIGVGALFILAPQSLIDFFIGTSTAHYDDIVSLGKAFFLVALVSNYADSIRYILSGAYRGLKDAKTPMVVGIVCLWGISIGMAYLLAIPLGYGPVGLRIGIGAGIVCATVYLLYDLFIQRVHGAVI